MYARKMPLTQTQKPVGINKLCVRASTDENVPPPRRGNLSAWKLKTFVASSVRGGEVVGNFRQERGRFLRGP
jgi:hypothetical protein